MGMSRSGTSLAGKILSKLGYFIENDSRPPDEHNPEGYFESKRVQDLNSRVLSMLGGSEDDPPRPEKGWESTGRFKNEVKKAAAIIRSYEGHHKWGMKDDRLSVTLPLWKLVLPPGVSYVICVRNPLAVVRSIAKMEPRHDWKLAFRSWYSHMSGAIKNTQGERRFLLFYEDFVVDPGFQASNIGAFLGVAGDEGILDAFKSGLSHEQPSLQDLVSNELVPEQTKELYLHLLEVRSGARRLDGLAQSLEEL